MEMAKDWAELPSDLVIHIAQRTDSMEDFVRFSVVCKPWLLAASTLPKEKTPLPRRYPWLMLEQAESKIKSSTDFFPTRNFFNLATKSVYELIMPETYGRICFGVNYGWLFTLGKDDWEISLFHPFSRDKIYLPPVIAFCDHDDYTGTYTHRNKMEGFIQKVTVSANPNFNEQDCVIVAIYGKFYAVDCHGVVVVCDIDGNQGPKSEAIAPPPIGTRCDIEKYLVESLGDLLLVSRVRGGQLYDGTDEGPMYYTTNFSVLKMETSISPQEDGYPYRWVPVDDLGDRALFIGKNSSVSLSTADYGSGCCFRPNCIYFTDSIPSLCGDGRDIGIFNLENGKIEHDHFINSLGMMTTLSSSNLSPPVWITI